MNKSSYLRMKWFRDNYIPKNNQLLKVLDVGSQDVNGSYKELFQLPRFKYYGLDICKDKNVDIVLNRPYNWDIIPSEAFDIIISGSTFEHIEFFWLTLEQMVRVLKNNGLLCIIAPRGYGNHRYPVDCWRFDADGMVALARYCKLEILHASTNCAPSENDIEWFSNIAADSILIAKKPYQGNARVADKYYNLIVPDLAKLRKPLVPYKVTIIDKIKRRLLN